MPNYEPPETGTLVISGLLLLALGFAGYWIIQYVQGGGAPWSLLPWFGAGAVIIIATGLVYYVVRNR